MGSACSSKAGCALLALKRHQKWGSWVVPTYQKDMPAGAEKNTGIKSVGCSSTSATESQCNRRHVT